MSDLRIPVFLAIWSVETSHEALHCPHISQTNIIGVERDGTKG